MEGELSFDNILGIDEVEDLFNEDSNKEDDIKPSEEETTEVNVDELFTEEPESVGSDEETEDIKDKGDTPSNKDNSPNNNLYSSIIKALKEESILPDLSDEDIKSVNSSEDFAEAIEKQIQSRLDKKQRRIDEALNADIEPSEIKKYENTLAYLESISEDNLTDESSKGEQIRQQLIYQDFINRGYSKERAQREVKKSLDSGTDIEDAKEALISNKEFFERSYNKLIEDAKKEAQSEIDDRKKQSELLKKSILDDSKVFGDISIDRSTRQKIYDNISKPIYKDPDTGELYTAIQKYEIENRTEFLKNIGILFTLTDGFKNIDKLVKQKVNKEVRKGFKELEHTISNTYISADGNLRFTSGVDDDPESFIGKNWKLDI